MSDIKGGGSLTALPIVETQAGDISAYIPTNVISITDGQIFLESQLFNSGLRPAINVGVSVSRVGGSAQIKAMKQIAGTLRLDLAQYRELAAFSQFSSELDSATKAQLERGERLTEILKQKHFSPQNIFHQIMIIYAGARGYLDRYQVSSLLAYERHLQSFLDIKYTAFMTKLRSAGAFTEELEAEAGAVLEDFTTMFNPDITLDSLESGLIRSIALAVSSAGAPDRRELLQIIERATAKELVTPSLKDDLEKMYDMREADEGAVKDRFDDIVEKCEIIDIREKTDLESLFTKAAGIISAQVNCDAKNITEQLLKREKSGTTALTPLLAVPHMIVPGEKKFSVVVARSVPGINFGPERQDVHAVFFLAGSIDERNFHLLALAAIAQIVNSPSFSKKWQSADGTNDLRRIMLSVKRKKTA
jgi:mannitol/fructose-specific phosphotransferase system IIA component (Ntr-type)